MRGLKNNHFVEEYCMKLRAIMKRVSFYAGRLRKERISKFVIMSTASLALVLQLTAGVFPLSQNSDAHAIAATPGDNIIYQGVTSKADMLAVYDRNVDAAGHKDIQQIYTQFGVTRADIANTTMSSYYTNDFGGKINTLSRMKWPIPGRTPVAIAGTNTTIYTGPFSDNSNHNKIEELALIGKRASDGQWFAITIHCGNLVYVVPPKPQPKPAAACVSLTIEKISRTDLNIIAKGTASNGATIKAYHYVVSKDGKVLTDRVIPTTGFGSQINQGYETGTYTAKVSVQTSLGELSSAGCTKTFTIPPAPAVPVYTCDSLTVTKINRTDVTATGVATASGGAKIVSYTFTFGDGTTKTVTNPTDVAHSYAKAGTYTVKLAVTVKVDGKTKTVTDDAKCVAKVTVTPPEVVTIEVCDLTTKKVITIDEKDFDSKKHSKDLNDCKEIVVCELETYTQITIKESDFDSAKHSKDVADCVKPVTPPELPHTGAGSMAGSVLGLGSVIASLGYYISSRRGLLSALLNR